MYWIKTVFWRFSINLCQPWFNIIKKKLFSTLTFSRYYNAFLTHPLYLPLALFCSSALPLLDTHLTLLQFFPSPWLPTAIQLPSLSLQSTINQTLNRLPALFEDHMIKNKQSFSDFYFGYDLFWYFLFESLISVIAL